MEVVDVADVFDGLEAEVVGGAVGVAALDAAAGEDDAEAVGVVVAAGAALADRGAAASSPPSPRLRVIPPSLVHFSSSCLRAFVVNRFAAGRHLPFRSHE